MGKITINEMHNSLFDYAQAVSDENLMTENKTIVDAINEIYGKRLIADSIGEPLNNTDTFTKMSDDINNLLSTFKTNIMNAGIAVESEDKFKTLIDKIKGLTEGEGNKGIQYIEGTVVRDLTHTKTFNEINGRDSSGSAYLVLPKLNFKPTVLIALSNHSSSDSYYYPVISLIVHDYNYNTLSAKTANFSDGGYDGPTHNFIADELVFLEDAIHLPVYTGNNTIFNWFAFGVGEEDTTLRDSLASILQEEGVGVTEEDGMASLITKVDEEFAEKNECINNNKNELLDILIKNGIDVSNIDNIDDVISLLNMLVIKSKTVRQIVAYNHTFILKDDGSLWGCGPNTYGELGIGKKEEAVKALYEIQNDVKQVSCGFWYSFILKNDGSVYSCGYNDNGQLGLGNSGEYTYKTSFTQVTTNINNDVKQIACGNSHTFILKNDGSLWSCGYNGNGQLGLGDTAKKTSFTQVTTNINNDVKEIACGKYHTFILKNDGSLWACGYNEYGQLGLGDNTKKTTFTQVTTNINNDVKQVVCGTNSTFIIKTDGSLWACGENEDRQLGLGDTTNRNTFTQVTTNINNDVKQVACGFGQSLVLKNDGSLWGCGYNGKYIGFGNGTIGNTFTQVTTNINNDVKYVACGDDCSFIIKNDETVWVCGEGGTAQLGTNTLDDFNVFTKIPNGFLN